MIRTGGVAITLVRGCDPAKLAKWERLVLSLRRLRWAEDAVTGERVGVKLWRGELFVFERVR